jgi:hypothetical protein
MQVLFSKNLKNIPEFGSEDLRLRSENISKSSLSNLESQLSA